MKVLHISTSDISGGAALAAYKLHNEMLNAGIFSRMLVLRKYSCDNTVLEYDSPSNLISRIRRKITRTILTKQFNNYKFTQSPHLELFTSPKTEFSFGFAFPFEEYDIIQLHFISGFIDIPSFFKHVEKPVFWRLADMNPLTGGCHYSWGCKKFTESCGQCPILGSKKQKDLSEKNLKIKQKVFIEVSPSQLTIITLSKWMRNNVSMSSIFNRFPIKLVPNGVDLTLFRPLNKIVIRENLGLPYKKKIILLIAESIMNIRKGNSIAFEAFKILNKKEDYLVLVVGKQNRIPNLEIESINFGEIKEKRFLSLIYSAADLFVSTSLHENFANTIIESMACGTPVLAFPTGGVLDVIVHGESGFLTKDTSATSLATGIECAFSDRNELSKIGLKAIEQVNNNYDLKAQAMQYIELYKSAIKDDFS